MGISWLFAHVFELHQHREESYPKTICLKFKVFWWKKYEVKYAEDRFQKWKTLGHVSRPIPNRNQPTMKTPEQKQKTLNIPSSSSSREEKVKFKKSLLEALSTLGSDSEEEEAASAQEDCYAIQMAQNPIEDEEFDLDSM